MAIANYLDLSIPPAAVAALVVGFLFPVYLYFAARMPVLPDAQGWQFLVSTAVMCVIWGAVISLGATIDYMDFCLGLMILIVWLLFYLEVWALLSRGYTLGMLVTIYEAGRPLTRDELASHYRGGDGLAWIMTHRLGGLISAGLVTRRGEQIELTAFPGMPVAMAYRAAARLLGLRKSG